ncbi:outer membrane beta-barrel protein [Pleionea sediminis]|uniref:outer membrane beta-barrel protein n=1 Tax=Pleionea sediminis TaxID=2569479 RepID=UPI001184F77B|nr:outer membrane beta-barrel protein [Pleionea sediminis]
MKAIALSLALAASFSGMVTAGDQGMFLKFGFGGAQINVKEEFSLIDQQEDEENSAKLGFAIGYYPTENLDVSLGFNHYSDLHWLDFIDAFDDYDLDETVVTLAYNFEMGKFSIKPSVGYSFWKFQADEGIFANPGDEETFRSSGSDMFAGIALQFNFTHRLGLELAYSTGNYDFGKVESTDLSLIFSL